MTVREHISTHIIVGSDSFVSKKNCALKVVAQLLHGTWTRSEWNVLLHVNLAFSVYCPGATLLQDLIVF